MTEMLYQTDSYLQEFDATIVSVLDEEREAVLDRTAFYPGGGGQPCDFGSLLIDGVSYPVSKVKKQGEDVLHLLGGDLPLPVPGSPVHGTLDWARRYKLMRMHTACHLLTVVCPYPITGASVSEDDSRVDFDMPEAGFSKEDVTARLMEMVRADHPVFTRWISDEEFAANPGLVKSKNVRPPVGTGRIRLVGIGENAAIDSQPCGGTHVARTGEIGEIHIGKIEKKGRENRRFRLRFGPLPPT